jgi:hypothetical protein
MNSIKNIIKSISIVSLVYGWFIPVLWLPSPQYNTEISEEEAFSVNFDIGTLDFDDVISDEIELTENTEPAERLDKDNQPSPKQSISKTTDTKSKAIPEKTEVATNFEKETSAGTNAPILRKEQLPFLKKRRTRTKRCSYQNPEIIQTAQTTTSAKFALPKKLVSYYRHHWKEANRLANLSWAKDRDGTVKGIRIRHIYCKSPVRFSGLKKGDIVLSVNSNSVQTNADLLKIYSKMPFWKKIELKILRKGKPFKLQYTLKA